MNTIDLAVIALYVTACTSLGAWLSSRSQGLKGYFLGESDIPTWAVMISIVATETSIITFLSVPGVAYSGDFRLLQLTFGSLLGRVVVATVLLPAYFRGELFTAYQLLKDRFGGPTRTTASLLFLVARSLGDGLRLFLAATVLEHLTGWSPEAAIVAVAAITVVYTFLGGMRAVIWTDVIQFSVYLLGALVALMILAGRLPGGWTGLFHTARAAGKFRLLDFSIDLTRPYTFWAGLIGSLVLNTATHGADQLMVQRYLSARSQRQAAAALIASGFSIMAQLAFFLLIGVSLWVFYRAFPPAMSVGSAGVGSSDEVFTYFIVHYLPTGVLGLVIASLFSAAMGTLAGSLNSAASTIVNDLYRPFTGRSDERHLVRISRLMTVVWGVVLAAVAFGARRLEDNALAIAGFVSGILLGLFLLGILTRRAGQRAAMIGVLAAAAVTFAKFATPVAFPWFALVGASTVFAVGLAASFVVPSRAKGLVADPLE